VDREITSSFFKGEPTVFHLFVDLLDAISTLIPTAAAIQFTHTVFVKPRSHSFQSRRRYGVDTGTNWDHSVATPASTALNRDTPC